MTISTTQATAEARRNSEARNRAIDSLTVGRTSSLVSWVIGSGFSPLYSRRSRPFHRGLLLPLRSFSNGSLFAETYGEGNPRVLALHGWGRRGKDFSQSLAGIPSIAVDLPGFGASPAPDDVIGAEGYAEIVGGILDVFERPPVLVGHSFGGRVATCLAASHPESFQELVLSGAPVVRTHPPATPKIGYRLMRSLNKAGVVSEARMESIRQRSGSADYRAASGVMRDILVKVVNESYETQLRSVNCHVLLLWGGSDSEVPVAVARLAADVIRQSSGPHDGGAELRVLEGVGHNVHLESPGELRRVVLDLLDGPE